MAGIDIRQPDTPDARVRSRNNGGSPPEHVQYVEAGIAQRIYLRYFKWTISDGNVHVLTTDDANDPADAEAAEFRIIGTTDTDQLMLRFDGQNPSATDGMPYFHREADICYDVANFRVIRVTAVTFTIHVQYFKNDYTPTAF